MKKKSPSLLVITLLEAVGFILVLLVIWLDELIDLPHLLFGAARAPVRLAEAWLESACVLTVCVCVLVGSRWLLQRIRHLESFVVVCAWCRKVRVDDRWILFEEYLRERGDVRTSHGICESCAEDQLKNIPPKHPV